jgi:hypothetical protein
MIAIAAIVKDFLIVNLPFFGIGRRYISRMRREIFLFLGL